MGLCSIDIDARYEASSLRADLAIDDLVRMHKCILYNKLVQIVRQSRLQPVC